MARQGDAPVASSSRTAGTGGQEIEAFISSVREATRRGPKQSAPPLIRAALNEDSCAFRQLLAWRDSANCATGCGKTPLHWVVTTGDPGVLRCYQNLCRRYQLRPTLDMADVRGSTALHYAAVTRNLLAVQELLKARATVDCRDAKGQTPLMKAANWDDVPLCRRLLAGGADVRAADCDGQTALHVAATANLEAVVRVLLASGARPDAADHAGRTPLLDALEHTRPSPLVRQWRPAAAWELRPAGQFTPRADESGRTEMHWAASNGTDDILTHLIGCGPPSYPCDKDGMTPLMCAIQARNEINVSILLDTPGCCRQEDVDHSGRNALHWAAHCGLPWAVRQLLRAGWSPWTADAEGRDVLMTALIGRDEWTVAAVLQGCGFQQRADRGGRTALHHAALHGTPGALLTLLQRGADADAVDCEGATPLASLRPGRRRAAAMADILACYATRSVLP